MADGIEDPVLRRLRELEERVDALDAKVESAAQAYSLARHRFRRVWLRPPLWTFEQYAPRALVLKPSYSREKSPQQSLPVAIVTPNYSHHRQRPVAILSSPYLSRSGRLLDRRFG